MSEIGNTGDVSFKAIDALIERTRSLEVAGDEDSHKRVAATVARLRRSDELIEAQGNNLMQITPLLRGRDDFSREPELQFVKGILPAEGVDSGKNALMAFAEELERVRVGQGGEVEPEPDMEGLGFNEIDRVIAARDRLTDEYSLLITAISRKLIGKAEFTKILDLDEKSSLGDIIARAVQPEIPPEPEPVLPPPGTPTGLKNQQKSTGVDSSGLPPEPQPVAPPRGKPEGSSLEQKPQDHSSEPQSESGGQANSLRDDQVHAVPESVASQGKQADVVFVIDASGSMRECFDQLRAHLRTFVEPFREEGFDSLRLGLFAYSANIDYTTNVCIYRNLVIGGSGASAMRALYGAEPPDAGLFFTRSGGGAVDVETFCRRLNDIRCKGDEDTPFALDCAADFPFGPLRSTRRVIVLFTDEKLEDGVLKQASIGENMSLFDKVMKKLVKRHITLYAFAPQSPVTVAMSDYSRVFFAEVPEFRPGNTDVWTNLDFERVLQMMGKKISSSLTGGEEDSSDRAVFGQDKWTDDRWE